MHKNSYKLEESFVSCWALLMVVTARCRNNVRLSNKSWSVRRTAAEDPLFWPALTEDSLEHRMLTSASAAKANKPPSRAKEQRCSVTQVSQISLGQLRLHAFSPCSASIAMHQG